MQHIDVIDIIDQAPIKSAELPPLPQGTADVQPPWATAPGTHEVHLRFDGSGSEYFRIWVVHTLLNLLSLGIYSPWSKVRKARWFAQHTSLLGERFDYHAKPLPILVGRLIALALLLAWSNAFGISVFAGMVVFGIVCVLGPLMFASAQRFRLSNTSWRGLRFGFFVPRQELYLVCLPALLVWTIGNVLQAAGAPVWLLGGAGVVAVLALPFVHARMKAMQHSRSAFSNRHFTFEGAVKAFYILYFKTLLLSSLVGVLASMVIGGIAAVSGKFNQLGPQGAFIIGLISMSIFWMLCWPFFAARMQAIVWPRTHWGDVGFRAEMRAKTMWGVVVKGGILTVLTAGFYWPFLAVALARYRIESIALLSNEPLESLSLDGGQDANASAIGDAAVDFFGLDIGW